MYKVCHNYLLIKPKMELELVPEFYRLFYSSSHQVVSLHQLSNMRGGGPASK